MATLATSNSPTSLVLDLILGVQYNSHLHAESEVREGSPFQPVAKRARLGWHVIGPDNAQGSNMSCVNCTRKVNLEKFYDFKTLGVRAPEYNCPQQTMTRDGRKAMELFESSCKKLNGRYEISLPWKEDPAKLPNNYPLVKQRLSLSFSKNPDKAAKYYDAIREYEINGWTRRLTESEIKSTKSPVNYLPHHVIYRPEKEPL